MWDSSFEFGFDVWFYGMKNSFFGVLHPVCLGVLRTLGFYINSRQLAINGHQYCVLRTLSPQRAEARLEEEMFINGYALKTR